MICRLFCCGPEEEVDDEFLPNNNQQFIGSVNKNINIQENQILEIYGLENYAMVRKTFKNFFILEKESQVSYNSSGFKELYLGIENEIQGNIQYKRIPKKVVQFLLERCAMTGTDLRIIVPYCGNGAIPLHIAQHKNISNVIAFDPNQNMIRQAEQIVSQNQLSNKIDLVNAYQLNFRLKADILFIYVNQYDSLYDTIVIKMAQLIKLAKSFVIILDINVNIQLFISQIMPFIRLIKLEIMMLSINGITQYNCILIGKVSATKFHSENATIINLLLSDINEKVLYLEKTEQLIKTILQVEKMQTIVKLLIQAKTQAQDNSILSFFFYLLTTHKITTPSILFQLYGDLYTDLHLQETGEYHQVSMSIRNLTFEFKDCKTISNENKSQSNIQKQNTLSFQNEKGW